MMITWLYIRRSVLQNFIILWSGDLLYCGQVTVTLRAMMMIKMVTYIFP